jgi:hypothetical protein
MMGDVITLPERKPDDKTPVEVIECADCQNKTWLVAWRLSHDRYPEMRCACCGNILGYVHIGKDGA